MKTFSNEIRESILKAFNYYCCVVGCYNKAEEIHHALHNTEVNNKKFPMFLQSIFNARPVCRNCHQHFGKHPELNISEGLAEAYESVLQIITGEKNVKNQKSS